MDTDSRRTFLSCIDNHHVVRPGGLPGALKLPSVDTSMCIVDTRQSMCNLLNEPYRNYGHPVALYPRVCTISNRFLCVYAHARVCYVLYLVRASARRERGEKGKHPKAEVAEHRVNGQ